MKGSQPYAGLFKTGQYDQFYFTSGSHERGTTFQIQILPKNEQATPNGSNNLCLNDNAVLVYGYLSGHNGWTEIYGWIHKGPWVADFNLMVDEALALKQSEDLAKQKKFTDKRDKILVFQSEILKNYVPTYSVNLTPEKKVCPDCGDFGELRDENQIVIGICPCHL